MTDSPPAATAPIPTGGLPTGAIPIGPGTPGAPPPGPPIPGTAAPTVARRIQALIGVLSVAVLTLGAMVLAEDNSNAPGTTVAPGAVAPTGETTEVTVEVAGMAFTPSIIEVPAGNELVITFRNTGDQRHDLVLAKGAETPAIAPGTEVVLEAGVVDQTMEGWCSLPGHRAMGMELTVVAVGGSAGDGGASDGGGAGDGGAGDGGSAHNGHSAHITGPDVAAPSMVDLLAAAEAATPHPAELPPLTDATHHEYTFTVTESTEEVADGVTRAIWTYNGTSPGPTLHGRIGDTFTITLVNAGTMGHSIDFHAGELAPDQPMRTIEPGESLVYEFTAHRSGVWMYHCSTMPMTQHIANGMFGAVIIEPDGLEPVDREYVLIQSELYLGAQGGPASDVKAAAMNADVMAFNGRAFQYSAHPLTAQVGERLRFWVLDAGPAQPLSFHVVGAQFDTVWTEGAYSVYRGTSTDGITAGVTGAQTLPLLAAQGGFVELVTYEPGRYAFVNHLMPLAEKGASGVLEVRASDD